MFEPSREVHYLIVSHIQDSYCTRDIVAPSRGGTNADAENSPPSYMYLLVDLQDEQSTLVLQKLCQECRDNKLHHPHPWNSTLHQRFDNVFDPACTEAAFLPGIQNAARNIVGLDEEEPLWL
jgi:hypothetical protein